MAKKKIKKKMKLKKVSKRPARRVPHAAKRHSASSRAKRTPAVKLSRRAMRPTSLIQKGKQQDKVKALIVLGKERGYITYDEILREFPTIEDNVQLLEEMYELFNVAGIDVLEGGGMLEDAGADHVLEKKKLQNRRSDSGYDSVQMYLREIGQYPLLNGQQVKDLAKRILQEDNEARNILARSN